MELDVEKGTKEGKDFQALSEKHSQVIAECQLKHKYLVIEAGDLDLVEKKNIAIISFMELVHVISEGFLKYDDREDIGAHLCSIEVIGLYNDHLAVHLGYLKERIFDEYNKKYELEEMPCARITFPLTASPAASDTPTHTANSKNIGE